MHEKSKIYAVKFGSIFILLTCLIYVDATLKTTFVEDVCRFKYSVVMNLDYQTSGILMASPANSKIACQITLMPRFGFSLVLSIKRYTLEPEDILTIEDSDRYEIGLIGNQDFPSEKKSILSDRKITVYYFRKNNNTDSGKRGFQFTFTQVKKSPCSAKEFRCKNDLCIPKDLACDGHNHCGDSSDQKRCVPKDDHNYEIYPTRDYILEERRRMAMLPLIGVIAGSLVLITIIIVLTVLIVKQAKAKKQRKANQPNASGQIGLQTIAPSSPRNQPLSSAPVNNGAQPRLTVFTQIRRSLRLHRSPQVEEVPKQQTSPEVPSIYPNLEQLPSPTNQPPSSVSGDTSNAQSRPTVFNQVRRSLRIHRSPQVEEVPKQQTSPKVPSIYPDLEQPPFAPDYAVVDNLHCETEP